MNKNKLSIVLLLSGLLLGFIIGVYFERRQQSNAGAYMPIRQKPILNIPKPE